MVLDPVHKDYFTNKLLTALQAIGNPPAARDDVRVRQATGQTGRGARRTAHTPPADFLWRADATAAGNAQVAESLEGAAGRQGGQLGRDVTRRVLDWEPQIMIPSGTSGAKCRCWRASKH